MIKIYLKLTCVFSLFTLFAHAQAPNFTIEYSNCFGGSAEEDYFAGSPSLDGGFLMSGFTNSVDGDIDPLLAYDTTNIFVAKCDQFGNKVWAKTFGGNDYDKARYIMQDADSNYLVVGVTRSTDGDIVNTHGFAEMFVLKLDPNGDKIWFKNYGGSGYEGGRYIQQLPSGDYLVGGYSTSNDGDVPLSRGQHDGWLMKIDTSGTIIWSQTYGGTGDDRLRTFIPTTDGGYLFLGSSSSTDLQVPNNHGGFDYWVGKVDSVGNLEWNQSYGGSGLELAYGLSAASDGGYYVTGTTYSNDGDVTGFLGVCDGWLVKIDSIGNLLWQQCYGGSAVDRLYRTFETAPGTLMTFGFSQSPDFDLTGANTGPDNKFWLAELDSGHQVAWSYCLGGSLGDFGIDLFIDPVSGSYTMAGESASPNGVVLNNHGDNDFWVVKIGLTTDIEDLIPTAPWHVFFDNTTNSLQLSLDESLMVSVAIYDITGKLVLSHKNKTLEKGRSQIPLDLNNGTYMVRIGDNKNTQSMKFVVIN